MKLCATALVPAHDRKQNMPNHVSRHVVQLRMKMARLTEHFAVCNHSFHHYVFSTFGNTCCRNRMFSVLRYIIFQFLDCNQTLEWHTEKTIQWLILCWNSDGADAIMKVLRKKKPRHQIGQQWLAAGISDRTRRTDVLFEPFGWEI